MVSVKAIYEIVVLVGRGSGGVPTRLTTMDWPPEAHEPGNVVFVHGYNMEEDDETPHWKQGDRPDFWLLRGRGFVI